MAVDLIIAKTAEKKYLKLRDKFSPRDKHKLYAKNVEKASNECFYQSKLVWKEESKASKLEMFDLCSFDTCPNSMSSELTRNSEL